MADCDSYVVCNGMVYRCGRPADHENNLRANSGRFHEALGEDPRDGEMYVMRWTTPKRTD